MYFPHLTLLPRPPLYTIWGFVGKFWKYLGTSYQDIAIGGESRGVGWLICTELNQQCTLSNAQLKQAIQQGALWLTRGKSTQRLRRVKKPLKTADTLHFYYDEQVLSQQPNEALLIEDCTDYSVWYKPYGMLSQGSKWSDHPSLVQRYTSHELPLGEGAGGPMVVLAMYLELMP